MNLVNTVIFLGAINVVGVGYVFARGALRRRRLNRRMISQHDGYVRMGGTLRGLRAEEADMGPAQDHQGGERR